MTSSDTGRAPSRTESVDLSNNTTRLTSEEPVTACQAVSSWHTIKFHRCVQFPISKPPDGGTPCRIACFFKRVQIGRPRCVYDDARPDAPPQELAQVEPDSRVPGV